MGRTIVEVMGLALAVAVVPIPMIAVILMLLSRSGTRNGVSFLSGWLLGLIGLGAILLAIDAAAASKTEGSDLAGYLRIAIGAVLLFLGWRKWRSRPQGDEEAQMPGWMSAIEDFGAAKSFTTGFLLAAANPKNIGLTFAAAATIATAGLTNAQQIVTLLVFVVVASLTVAIPVIAYLLAGARATPTLERMREWLVANAKILMTVLFVVLGLVLLADGISSVAG
jgi:threonine/homoserine/homoserine lactone efflux protein